ncbi:hypothetical protein [Pseudomonas sp. RIT-PI-AD]|uniref:hypothetical protein n=1 Tax=Pseudomonas sp. RIT-PI-AD TaxID=3035294 RepID=UPI0021D92C5C|nr:hypothetical protein [Pseudomonas sp. RIT-PI-AD]
MQKLLLFMQPYLASAIPQKIGCFPYKTYETGKTRTPSASKIRFDDAWHRTRDERSCLSGAAARPFSERSIIFLEPVSLHGGSSGARDVAAALESRAPTRVEKNAALERDRTVTKKARQDPMEGAMKPASWQQERFETKTQRNRAGG